MRSRLKSFTHAFQGLRIFFQEEIHATVHLFLAVVVCLMGFWLRISMIEWVIVVICIFSVFGAEIFNTAIERLSDKVQKEYDPLIKKTKDLASAGVLVISFMSIIVACIIFIPKMTQSFL